ncbi:MAG: hypothetical protein WCD53_19955 [Microcoleus sp.]
MGGRGGGKDKGKWPTLKLWIYDTIFFNGIEEARFNTNGDIGFPKSLQFTVDEWGNKSQYIEVLRTVYSGSGVDLKISTKPEFVGVGYPISLIGQAMGQYYRIGNIRFGGKVAVWANRIYPSWALETDKGDEGIFNPK